MYICLECGHIFEEPKMYFERHGLDTPPYEAILGCPCCAGAYAKTMPCDVCGAYISGEYAETADGCIYCEECYIVKNIED